MENVGVGQPSQEYYGLGAPGEVDVAQRGSLQRKESGMRIPVDTSPYPKAGPARTPQPQDQVGWSRWAFLCPGIQDLPSLADSSAFLLPVKQKGRIGRLSCSGSLSSLGVVWL